jgi:hypothetical protein
VREKREKAEGEEKDNTRHTLVVVECAHRRRIPVEYVQRSLFLSLHGRDSKNVAVECAQFTTEGLDRYTPESLV